MRRVGLWAAGLGLAAVVLPWLVPSGPVAGLDLSGVLSGGHLWLGALLAASYGLLTALTPCVYPLIPITVSVFGAKKAESRGRAVALTSAYVLGMGLVFAGLGVLAAKTGQLFGSQLGRPAIALPLALVLVVLASSMFGAFDLNLPPSLANRLSTVGGAGLLGALLMGSVSGFLAAPCTGPALLGLLTFVAQSQSTLLGGGLLFVYALGMGLPFFVLGAFAVRLPRGGEWMDWVKSLLGVVLLCMAFLYVKDSLPALRGLVARGAGIIGGVPGAWAAGLAVAVGIWIGALHRSFKEGLHGAALKGLGVALVVGALVVRVAALAEPGPGRLWVRAGLARPKVRPVLGWALKLGGEAPSAAPFDALLKRAREEGRPVMIDFSADWCAACKELERVTYVAPDVVDEAGRFLAVQVDGTNDADVVNGLEERFGVKGLPTVAFISSGGELLKEPRFTGFVEPPEFLAALRRVR